MTSMTNKISNCDKYITHKSTNVRSNKRDSKELEVQDTCKEKHLFYD